MISISRKTPRSLVAVATLSLALLTPAAAPAAPTVVNCSPTKMKIVASTLVSNSPASNSFSNIAETTVGFTQGGINASCVIVRFSAETFSIGAANNLRIRPFLDNTTTAFPPHVRYSGDDGTVSTVHSFEFVFPSVAPGNHAIRIQGMSSAGGGSSTLSNRTTVVQFAP